MPSIRMVHKNQRNPIHKTILQNRRRNTNNPNHRKRHKNHICFNPKICNNLHNPNRNRSRRRRTPQNTPKQNRHRTRNNHNHRNKRTQFSNIQTQTANNHNAQRIPNQKPPRLPIPKTQNNERTMANRKRQTSQQPQTTRT